MNKAIDKLYQYAQTGAREMDKIAKGKCVSYSHIGAVVDAYDELSQSPSQDVINALKTFRPYDLDSGISYDTKEYIILKQALGLESNDER